MALPRFRQLSDPSELVTIARRVLTDSLEPDLRDDRFADSWANSLDDGAWTATVAETSDAPVGLVVGSLNDSVIQFDGLVVETAAGDAGVVLSELLALAIAATPDAGRVELWAKPATEAHVEAAVTNGLEPLRALHQMRCQLPVADTAATSRSFVWPDDAESLLRVNNRAFASHPDQGGMTLAYLESARQEPWFREDGIRLHEIDGDLAGFCWTKIHAEPPLGEIYAIGVDPDHHGKGLGVPMTVAGLEWLAAQGLDTGMLYVEADNEPALRTYDRIGFTILRTDRAWVRTS